MIFLLASHIQIQQILPVALTMLSWGNNTGNLISGATPLLMQPNFPCIPDAGYIQNLPTGNTLPPQVIYKPSNQDITYKQNIYIRWLKPPTPPPPAPIIVRGKFSFCIDRLNI